MGEAVLPPHRSRFAPGPNWAGANEAHRSLLVRLTAAGTVLWNHFSLTDESRTHLRRATIELREAGVAGTAVEMNLQLALAGAVLYTRGIVPEAREAMDRALAIAVEQNDTEHHLHCLRMIGTYELFGGDNDAGIRTLETFVSMATVADPSAVARAKLIWAVVNSSWAASTGPGSASATAAKLSTSCKRADEQLTTTDRRADENRPRRS